MGKSSESRKRAVETRLVVPKNARTQRRRPRGVIASNLPRRRFLRLAAGAAALPAASCEPGAQSYPSRPITMIVGLAAGAATDTIGRVIADRMKSTLGQRVIVENVTGAGGTIGAGRVARAAPDGYTLGIGNNGVYVMAGASYAPPRENPPPPSVRRSPLFGCIYYRLQPTQILPAPAIRRPHK